MNQTKLIVQQIKSLELWFIGFENIEEWFERVDSVDHLGRVVR